jgi:hypothetical protein
MHHVDVDRLPPSDTVTATACPPRPHPRGEVAEIADVDMHLGALTHVEPMAEIEPAAGPVGAGQVDQ